MACTIALLIALAAPQEPQPQNPAAWPRFRGPAADSVVAGGAHPSRWGEDEAIAWTAEVPGGGWSSPVVIRDRVYLTTAVAKEGGGPVGFRGGVQDPATRGRGVAAPTAAMSFEVRCLDLMTGAEAWTRVVRNAVPAFGVHPSNTYATETPATDGERLFVTYGAVGEVVALDLEGEELWRAETGVFPTGNDFGWGSSLLHHDGLVYLQNDNEKESFVVALDAASGEERWRAARPRGTCWASPLIWGGGDGVGDQLVTCGPDHVTSYEPRTGEVRWMLEGVGGSFSASPTACGERLLFGNSGPMSRGPLMAVRRDASGTHRISRRETPEIVAWREERAGPGFASPLVLGGLVYIVASPGASLACYDAATGERHYRERLPDAATVVASPWSDGERVYVLDEEGRTFVVRAGTEYELLATNELDGLFWATPSVAEGALLLRSATGVTCVRAASRPSP